MDSAKATGMRSRAARPEVELMVERVSKLTGWLQDHNRNK